MVCLSNTCPFKVNGKCTNRSVIEGAYCMSKSAGKVKKSKINIPEKTKRQMIFDCIESNKNLDKDKLYTMLEKRFKIKRSVVRKYFSDWKKENEGDNMKNCAETIKDNENKEKNQYVFEVRNKCFDAIGKKDTYRVDESNGYIYPMLVNREFRNESEVIEYYQKLGEKLKENYDKKKEKILRDLLENYKGTLNEAEESMKETIAAVKAYL